MKRVRFLPVVLAAGLLLFGACAESETEPRGLSIAVIPKGTTHEFWKSIHEGALKAQAELAEQGVNVEVIWKGPLKEDDREQQIQVVENFIGRRVDGIVLAPLDADALVAPTEAASRAQIPVVIIDSDLNTDQRISYVATDNFQGGVLAGEHLGRLVGGRGKVLLLRYQTGSASTEAREAGFLEAIRSNYPEIELVSTEQHSGATRETAYQAAENLLNRFGRELSGIFTPNESSSVGMLLALRDVGLLDRVSFVGFDAGTQLIEALEAGEIDGLVIQNPTRMGYDGVLTLVAHLRGEEVPKHIDTGVVLVTRENLGSEEVGELLR